MLDEFGYTKGRGAQYNPKNKFLKDEFSFDDEYLNHTFLNDEQTVVKTTYLDVYPKTIVNKVGSADVPMGWSMNPYQGCEHGCVYCYARNSHEYWGYSAGVDFESKILVKRNAPELLEQKLQSRAWIPETIVMSGNTDCYQPIEKKLEITRSLLKVFSKYKNPVGIITKNALVTRDIDLLKPLAEQGLVHVNFSLTSLNEVTRRKLEPRTASVHARLKAIEELSKHKIPIRVLLAPIIPSVNDHEIPEMVKKVAELGARDVSFIFVRLNGQVGAIFSDWLSKAYPDRAEKVLSQIRESHSGDLNDSRMGTRMRGDGKFSENVETMFRLTRNKYFKNVEPIEANIRLFRKTGFDQLDLFG